ncbi:hypothetical protein TNCV_1620801 [Trichonephila clavipes]|nr:hypothetical protein TNCV_1620801 [Trichonephila clavipes]
MVWTGNTLDGRRYVYVFARGTGTVMRHRNEVLKPFVHLSTGAVGPKFNLMDGNVKTATAGSDVVQSGRPIFDDFFQHLWPYIGNNTANVVFQMVKRSWLIRIDQ